MRRVVVTNARSPLARRLIAQLRDSTSVEHVRGIDSRGAPRGKPDPSPDVDTVPIAPDHRPFLQYLQKGHFDTVIQCGMAADRGGRPTRSGDADVIGTMCLGAAVGHEDSGVRSWVVLSSSSIYPIESHASLLQREDQSAPQTPDEQTSALEEAEEYARDLAIRNPHINVAILRLQNLCGRGATSPLASALTRDPIPLPIGFDPAIQLLHVDDAVDAITLAATRELAGVYNVASRGMIRLSEVVRFEGLRGVPVVPLSVPFLEKTLNRLRVPNIPDEVSALFRYGHVIDTAKLERAGYRPRNDQRDCLRAIRDSGPRRRR